MQHQRYESLASFNVIESHATKLVVFYDCLTQDPPHLIDKYRSWYLRILI